MTAILSEFELIARYFAPMSGEGAFGLLDDAAAFTPRKGCDLVVTKDALVEGVHFFPHDPPDAIARKILRVNLSDLTAKGAVPRGFLLALGRGKRQNEAFFEVFAPALAQESRTHGCVLLGGDTVKTGQAFFCITAFGEVPAGRMVRRQSGGAGDALYVSGTIGDAALGLRLRLEPDSAWAKALLPNHRDFLLDRYLHPQPRLALAPVLLAHASAAMDISDGLVGDCDKLAATLGRTITIGDVPLSDAARAALALDASLIDVILTGGDDYEILAAIPPGKEMRFIKEALRAGVPVAKIGQLDSVGTEKTWLGPDGRPRDFARRSYTHF